MADNIHVPSSEYELRNDVEIRYSPISSTHSVGLYAMGEESGYSTGAQGVKDIMSALMSTTFWQSAWTGVFGKNPKDYVLGLRFYYGLKDAVRKYPDNVVPYVYTVTLGDHYLLDGEDQSVGANRCNTSHAVWKTGYMDIPDVSRWETIKSWGTAYSYGEPYLNYLAHYQLYLPYYGFVDLAPADVVGGAIRVIYNIDLATGATVIDVVCYNPGKFSENKDTPCGVEHILCSLTTTVGVDVPFAVNVTQNATLFGVVASVNAFKTGASLGMSSGMGEMMNSQSMANAAQQSAQQSVDNAQKLYNSHPNQTTFSNLEQAKSNLSDAKDAAAANQAKFGGYTAAKPIIENLKPVMAPPSPARSNGFSPNHAGLACLCPYLCISIPHPVNTSYEQHDMKGQHYNRVGNFGTYAHGFTQIDAVLPSRGENAPAKPIYAAEIIELLKSGVYASATEGEHGFPPVVSN